MGDALRSRPRDEYVLSTKVGLLLEPRAGPLPTDAMFVDPLPFQTVYDYSYDATMRSFEDSLQRLGLNRIDIVLIHNLDAHVHGEAALPEHFRTAMNGAYKALEKLRGAGTISAIGLGVNRWEVCDDALEEGDFDCFLLAGRYTLLVQTALDTFLPKCVERGVSIILGAPFNTGILVRPPARKPTFDDTTAPQDVTDRVQRIREVCERHAVPVAAALRATVPDCPPGGSDGHPGHPLQSRTGGEPSLRRAADSRRPVARAQSRGALAPGRADPVAAPTSHRCDLRIG